MCEIWQTFLCKWFFEEKKILQCTEFYFFRVFQSATFRIRSFRLFFSASQRARRRHRVWDRRKILSAPPTILRLRLSMLWRRRRNAEARESELSQHQLTQLRGGPQKEPEKGVKNHFKNVIGFFVNFLIWRRFM